MNDVNSRIRDPAKPERLAPSEFQRLPQEPSQKVKRKRASIRSIRFSTAQQSQLQQDMIIIASVLLLSVHDFGRDVSLINNKFLSRSNDLNV